MGKVSLMEEVWEKYLLSSRVIKNTCSWRDKLIILWTLNRQAKIFLCIKNLDLQEVVQTGTCVLHIACPS